ncbi:MAG TPA: D-alanyl-D-alanine carboxypeptidase, partial [Acidobacteriota bacterium]|nr:D-alanyl-D-alanine carboxypeptidase [Acidobacteriota bacterium]
MRKLLRLLLFLPLLMSAFAGLSGQFQSLPSSASAPMASSSLVDHPTYDEFEAAFPLPPRLADSSFELSSESEVARQIDAILNGKTVRRGLWGVDVFSIDDGKFIYSRNSDHPLTPASNVKVFTTAAALNVLGA